MLAGTVPSSLTQVLSAALVESVLFARVRVSGMTRMRHLLVYLGYKHNTPSASGQSRQETRGKNLSGTLDSHLPPVLQSSKLKQNTCEEWSSTWCKCIGPPLMKRWLFCFLHLHSFPQLVFVEKWGMGCKTNRVGGVPATSTWLWGWHTQHYVAQHLSNSSLRIGRPVASPKAQPATLSVFLVEQSGHFSSSQVAVNWYFGLVVRGG